MRWFGRPQATIALPSGAENVNLKLRETITALLEGVIVTAWPDQVFAMSPVGDEHGEASTISGTLC